MKARWLALCALVLVTAVHAQTSAQTSARKSAQKSAQKSVLRPYRVVDDTIAASLTGQAGDAGRGALLMQQRQKSLCVLCHSGPFPDAHLQGTIAPDLTGVASRLSAAQLRLRIVDMKRLNPQSVMPTYYAIVGEGGARVAANWRGKPILNAEEIEDLVAYLQTLKP
jgi:sulfur-oxidizing protein SoxX